MANGQTPKLEAKGVGRVFERRGEQIEALVDIDLKVEEGDFLTIVGPSGCGKSTLLMIAAGLDEPTTGEIYVDGKLATKPGPDRAVVFQRFALFPAMTVAKNVGFGLSVAGVPAAEIAEKVAVQIKLMHLEGFEKAYPHELSGGMQQRAAIARSLILEPDILLMDEPFGALDAQTRTIMQEEVARLARELNLTILFITHSVVEAVYLGRKIAIMTKRPGRLKEVMDTSGDVEWRGQTAEIAASSSDFIAIREHVWDSVREEIGAAHN
jgi:NitT/TauT family transport system ATP-binding protein